MMEVEQDMATAVVPTINGVGQVVLQNVSWAFYEQALAELHDPASIRLTYSDGDLQIMSLGAKHETINRAMDFTIQQTGVLLRLPILATGSTTCKRNDLQKGFEPDSSFYIARVDKVLGKETIDLERDPPPDLVVEIDITNTSMDKLPIFAAVGVSEVWRYSKGKVTFYWLEDDRYVEAETSLMLPPLTAAFLTDIVAQAQRAPTFEWLPKVAEWIAHSRGNSTGKA